MDGKCFKSFRLQTIIFFTICISLFNIFIGILIFTSIISIYETPISTEPSNKVVIPNEIFSAVATQIKNEYDYYFLIDYTISRGACQPLYTFNTTETIHSIQNTTTERIREILSKQININLQILKINTQLTKSERARPTISLVKAKKLLCSYILNLFVGIDFPLNCNDKCRSVEVDRMTLFRNPFNDLSLKFLSISNKSNKKLTEYYIENVALFRSVKYLEERVFIQSIIEYRYISALVIDSSASRTSVSLSKYDKSLFLMKKGLNCLDSSSVYVSFLYYSSSNLYLRHENGRIKLSKNDQTNLFKQDATFKLIFDHKNDIVAFQTINLSESVFLSVNTDTNTTLVVTKYQQQTTVDKFDQQFIFKIISAT